MDKLFVKDFVIRGLNETQINRFRRRMIIDNDNEIKEIYKVGVYQNVHIRTNIFKAVVMKVKILIYNKQYGTNIDLNTYYGKHNYNAI